MNRRCTLASRVAAIAALWCALAAGAAAAQPADVNESLLEVRRLIRSGLHEDAIEAAKTAKVAVEAAPADSTQQARAYLLLALSYVNYANFQANERRPMAAETLYKEARAALVEGLSNPALHDLQIDRTPGEYPPEMIELFDRVRAELFGGLRIIALDPPDARVLLDGRLLPTLPGEAVLGDAALPVGPHTITVARDGYRIQEETIHITPNSWQERPYRLTKKRSKRFYALVGAGVVAAAGGVVALAGDGGSSGPAPLEPLPGPPPPPPNP
jgi:hypothetical protein